MLMTASMQDAEDCDVLKAEDRPLTAASKSSLQQVSL